MSSTSERILKAMQKAYPRPLINVSRAKWAFPRRDFGFGSHVANTREIKALAKEGLVLIKGRRAILTPAGVEWKPEKLEEV